jgi:hypothetical protein
MRRTLILASVLGVTVNLLGASALAQTPSADGDDWVTFG